MLKRLKNKLVWLLIGKALLFRKKQIEDMMDVLEAEMLKEDKKENMSNMYFRYYDRHDEVDGLITYLKG